MLGSVQKTSYGYTQNGNKYEKSSVYKTRGEYLAVGYLLAQAVNKKSGLNFVMDAINKPENLTKLGLDKATKVGKYLMNNKMARVAFCGAILLGGTYLMIGAGKLIGHCFDKIADSRTKREADRNAQV